MEVLLREVGEDNMRIPEVYDVENARGPILNSRLRHNVEAEQWEE